MFANPSSVSAPWLESSTSPVPVDGQGQQLCCPAAPWGAGTQCAAGGGQALPACGTQTQARELPLKLPTCLPFVG